MKYIISLYHQEQIGQNCSHPHGEYEAVLVIPERRAPGGNRTNRSSILNRIRGIMGDEWYEKNRNFMMIITDYEREETRRW